MSRDKALLELKEIFQDVINYDDEDPLASIDPENYVSPEGDTCLHLAAIRGDKRAVVLLLELGLPINKKGDMGNTALHYAVAHKHPEIAELLIEHGASKDVVNEFGKRPLGSEPV